MSEMSTASKKGAEPKCFEHNKLMSMMCKTCEKTPVCYKCVGTSHKGHMIVALKRRIKVGTVGNFCAKHEKEYLFVCETCGKQPLCKTCFYPWHKGHTIIEYNEYIKKLRERFLRIETSERKNTIDKVTAAIKKKRDELKRQVDTVAEKFAAESMALEKKSHTQPRPVAQEFVKFETNFPDVQKLFGRLK